MFNVQHIYEVRDPPAGHRQQGARVTTILTDADVRAAFDWAEAIAALRSAYSAPPDESRFPARTIARGDGLWLRTLSGACPATAAPWGPS